MTCHSEIYPALSTFCLLLLRPQAHCLPPLDVIEYLSHLPLQVYEVPVISLHRPQQCTAACISYYHSITFSSTCTPGIGWCPPPTYKRHIYMVNNSLWAKTVTYSMGQHRFAINNSLESHVCPELSLALLHLKLHLPLGVHVHLVPHPSRVVNDILHPSHMRAP